MLITQSAVTVGQAQTWDAAKDLATNEKPDLPDPSSTELSNPNGKVPEWSYGYRANYFGTDFTLFAQPPEEHTNAALGGAFGIDPVDALEGWQQPDGFWPIITTNVSGKPARFSSGLVPLAADELFIHPGNGFSYNSAAIVRWTAPASATYEISAAWRDLDPINGDGIGAHIVVNGASVFDQNLGTGGSASDARVVSLSTGDMVDFVVDPGPVGNQISDSSGLKILIHEQGDQQPLEVASIVSRVEHDLAGPFDIPLPLKGHPGVECRATNGSYTLVFTFSNAVTDGQANVAGGTAIISGQPAFLGNTMTVKLAGVTDVQTVVVSISGVTDAFGQVLAETRIRMGVLIGDTSGNGEVSNRDFKDTRRALREPVDEFNFRNDVDANGVIGVSDIVAVRKRSGNSLP